jgi:hypothetical protein
MRFSKQMQNSLPERLVLPHPIVQALDWLEAVGAVEDGYDGNPFAFLYPGGGSNGLADHRSLVAFEVQNPGESAAWLTTGDPEIDGRLGLFVRTGGDGSRAGIWCDDDGRVRFVHLGSGSGSTWMSVITDDPVQFLRLLAMGYPEACWPEEHGRQPLEVYRGWRDDPADPPFDPPAAFQDWLGATFGASIPATASEVVGPVSGMDDKTSDDPFWQWVRQVQGDA